MEKLIVLMTKSEIQAAFLENGEPMPVSFAGSVKMSYESEKDFTRFSSEVLDTFNLESFEGADMSAILINCGAESEKANALNTILSALKKNSTHRPQSF